MKDLPEEPIRRKKQGPVTTESSVEDPASMPIRGLPPPPSSDAATLARIAARVHMAIERPPRQRPRGAILLIAAAIGLVLSVAGAALRTVPSRQAIHDQAEEATKNTIEEHTPSVSLDAPAIPAPGTEEVDRAAPLPLQNGSGSHRARSENGIHHPAPEPTADGPEIAEALWLGRALRKLRVEHDPNGALGLLDGYEARFPARVLAAEVLLARVEAQLGLGRRAEALRLIEAVDRGSDKESRQIVLIRGELRAGAGRCREALADFDGILAQPGADAITERALYARAVCYLRLQQRTAAERDFGAYLRRFPERKIRLVCPHRHRSPMKQGRSAAVVPAGVVVLLLLGCARTFVVGSYDPGSGGPYNPDAGGSYDSDSEGSPTPPGWRLVWHDEFDGPAGSAPDPAMWTYDVGGTGWGNAELQFYTAREQNAFLDGDGTLVIHAALEPYMGLAYTSARLKTQGRFEQAYGRFEVRARVPTGQGLWSSFWMLGNDRDVVGWPESGDINVMSVLGVDATVNHGGAHGPGYGENVRPLGSLGGSPSLADDFHLYAVEWETEELRYYLDDVLYATKGPADLPSGASWVQDHPYFLLLSLAVGGPAGTPSAPAFPADLRVEFVRVYAR